MFEPARYRALSEVVFGPDGVDELILASGAHPFHVLGKGGGAHPFDGLGKVGHAQSPRARTTPHLGQNSAHTIAVRSAQHRGQGLTAEGGELSQDVDSAVANSGR